MRVAPLLLLLARTSALRVDSSIGRRAACQRVAAASAATLLPHAVVAAETATKEKALLKDTSSALKTLLVSKQAFIDNLATNGGESVTLPAQVPFTTFQKLEKNSDPEFMEAAIDYAEAFRGAKDLVKLAKLTQQPVLVTTKEKGKPRIESTVAYGDAPGSGLSSAREYAERAVNELVGASLALDAAIGYMQ
jgi:DNA-binding phage protein